MVEDAEPRDRDRPRPAEPAARIAGGDRARPSPAPAPRPRRGSTAFTTCSASYPIASRSSRTCSIAAAASRRVAALARAEPDEPEERVEHASAPRPGPPGRAVEELAHDLVPQALMRQRPCRSAGLEQLRVVDVEHRDAPHASPEPPRRTAAGCARRAPERDRRAARRPHRRRRAARSPCSASVAPCHEAIRR